MFNKDHRTLQINAGIGTRTSIEEQEITIVELLRGQRFAQMVTRELALNGAFLKAATVDD